MSTEAKVGAFVVVALLTVGVTVYFVRAVQHVTGEVRFITYLQNAAGIAPGTPVLFGGIRVGQVTDVRSSDKNPARIQIGFAVKPDTPINEKSIARVGTVSIMGSQTLQISTGSNDARRLKAREVVPSQETITADEIAQRLGAIVGDLQRELPGLTREARSVLANANEITGPRNQAQIQSTLVALNAMVQRESPKVARITDQISALAEHADGVVSSLQPLVSDADATLQSVREPLTQLERALQDARALIGSIRNVVQDNDVEVADAVRALRETSDNLRTFSETLKQRPWNLIRASQPPDRKVPQ
jgi:phospholipid/cholesterol/gamma-HCH transport system substrate-binding protein